MSLDENFNFSEQQPIFGNQFQMTAFDKNIGITINNIGEYPNIMVDYNNNNHGFQEECLAGDTNTFITPTMAKHPDRRNRRVQNRSNSNRMFGGSNDDDFIKMIMDEDDGDNNSNNNNEDELCNNPLCDHKELAAGELPIDHTKTAPVVVDDVSDLIKLGKTYHCKKNREYYGINLRILCNLVVPLTELQELVGMSEVKTNIVNQIIFFLQGFNKQEKCKSCVDCRFNLPCAKNLSNDMLHTVITGPPGVGKTELGKILGKVYKGMGVLSKGHVKVVSRSDLVGKYLGHTAAKTQDVIDECSGGVMFIDEAYALGNSEGRDSFSKECLDTLNQNLTERRDFLCIIAGYKDALENCFFNYNPGLKRRFTFKYDIIDYSPSELKDIFNLKIHKENWQTEYKVVANDTPEVVMNKHTIEQQVVQFFAEHMQYFPHFGGDVETFFLNCKIHHSRRVMFLPADEKRVLTYDDMKNGFQSYLSSRQFQEDAEHKERVKNAAMMY